MRIPVIVPLTPETFATLFELEAQAMSLEDEYRSALNELSAHVQSIAQRMEKERSAIKQQLSALEEERGRIQAFIQAATKEKMRATIQKTTYSEPPEAGAFKLRLIKIPEEETSLYEIMGEIVICEAEEARYGELYSAARDAGERVNAVTRKRKNEIDAPYTIIHDRMQTGTFNGGVFPFDRDLSSVSTRIYKLNQKEEFLHGKKVESI